MWLGFGRRRLRGVGMVTATARAEASTRVGALDAFPEALGAITLRLPSTWSTTNEAMLSLSSLNDEWLFELTADGELVIMTGVGFRSSERAFEIGTDISLWNRQAGGGHVCGADLYVRRADTSLRLPDVAWISAERLAGGDPDEGVLEVCPELIVEVVSVSQDISTQQKKMTEWMAAGALLGWLIDPYQEIVLIHRAEGEAERLERPGSLSGEDVCVGLEVSLERVWQ